jgi:hypothetical protein
MEMERVKNRHRSDSETPVGRMEAIDLEAGQNTGNNPIVMGLSGSQSVPALNLSQIDQQKLEMKEMVDTALESKFGPGHNLHDMYRKALKKKLKEMNNSPEPSKREALASLRQLSTDRKTRKNVSAKGKEKSDSSSDDSEQKSELHPGINSLITTVMNDCLQQEKKHKWIASLLGLAGTGASALITYLFNRYFGTSATGTPMPSNTSMPL